MEKLRLDLFNDPDGAAADEEEYDLSFYEDIEAPKYVDFTAPDLSLPDDRSWFCVRIGCHENHEEVDPDELYRRFILRVMSARSPNVRLRRKLDRKAPSAIPKCPHTAPAKEAKSRIARLSTMTSFPEKMAKAKLKEHPISSLRSTPRQVKAKYLCPAIEKAFTSPRKKKCAPDGDQFRSVKNQKAPAGASKIKNVAKVLFMDTKTEINETGIPIKPRIPASEVCAEMKKLKATSRKKIVPSRYLSTSATPKSAKKDEVSGEDLKRTEESARSLKLQKISSKQTRKLETTGNSGDKVIVAADVENIMPGSATTSTSLHSSIKGSGTSSRSGMVQIGEENKENEALNMEKMRPGSAIPAMTEISTNTMESTLAGSGASNSSRQVQNSEENRENELHLMQPCSMPTMSHIAATELDENKENSLGMDETRETDSRTRNSTNDILQHALPKGHRPQNKSCNVACDQGGKSKRITNPKPFRFRTDERGILKERNMEKRFQVTAHKATEPLPRHGERVKQAGTFAHAVDDKIVSDKGMQNALQNQAVSETPKKNRLPMNSPHSHKTVSVKQKIAGRVDKIKEIAPNCIKGTTSHVKTKKNDVSIAAVGSKVKRPVTVPREPHFHRIRQPKDCCKREEEI